MNVIKSTLAVLLLAVAPVFSFAQENPLLKPTYEIVELEVNDSNAYY